MGEAKRRRAATLLPFRPGLKGDVTTRVCEGNALLTSMSALTAF